jgi:hypothetical protein
LGFTSVHWWQGNKAVSSSEYDLDGRKASIFVTFPADELRIP